MPSKEKIHFDNLTYPTVVVVGGGFAGLELIKRLENKPYKVILVDRQNHHCFQPLLYQVATASLGADSIAHPFRRTVGPMSNVAFRMAKVFSVNAQENFIITDHGRINYDHLILAVGSKTNFFGNQALKAEAMQLKSLSQALDIRSDFLQEFETAIYLVDRQEQRKYLNFVIVGAGPTGVELAGALAEIRRNVLSGDYREVDSELMQIWLIDSNDRVLKFFSEKSSANALRYLHDLGVNVRLNSRVTTCDEECIHLDDGTTMETHTIIWAAGVTGAVVKGLDDALNERGGRYKVDRFNRMQGHENIFAIGDIAEMIEPDYPHGHPQVAPVAKDQATMLAKNLMRLAKGEKMEEFSFHYKGQMATIGRYKAVVDLTNERSFGGFFAWLVWMFVHVMQLVNFRNRIMVLMNWGWKYFSWDNTVRLIIRPYIHKAPKPEDMDGEGMVSS